MKMTDNRVARLLLPIMLCCTLASCNKDSFYDPEDIDVKLSCGTEINTARTMLFFDIQSGTPPFNVTCDDYSVYSREYSFPTAEITVTQDTVVRIDLLNNTSVITVQDSKGKSASVNIFSTDEKVNNPTMKGTILYSAHATLALSFGYGEPYSIVAQSDNGEVFAEMDGERWVTMWGIEPLATGWVILKDKMGVCQLIYLEIGDGWDITGTSLSVDVDPGEMVTFPIKWGDGWKVTSEPEKWWDFTLFAPGDVYPDWTFVVIPDDEPGSFVFTNDLGEEIHLYINMSEEENLSRQIHDNYQRVTCPAGKRDPDPQNPIVLERL